MSRSIRIRSGLDWPQLFDCLLAIESDPGNLMPAASQEHPAHGLDGQRNIIDNRNSHEPASPIKSITAWSSVSSWKRTFGQIIISPRLQPTQPILFAVLVRDDQNGQ